MALGEIHRAVESTGHKPWQVYFLFFSLLAAIGLHFDIRLAVSLLSGIEGFVSSIDWLVIMGIQGVLIGFVAEAVYEQGDRYAKVLSDEFGTKDRTLAGRLLMMTAVSGIITKIVPSTLRGADYFILQSTGALVVLGIFLVHRGSSDWNWETEWPAIAGGLILAIAPFLT